MEIQYPKDEVIRYDPAKGPSSLVLDRPHYHRVIKGTGEPGDEDHLAWRQELYRNCAKSSKARDFVTACCKEDALFFVNFASWLYEPRDSRVTIRAFNSWPHQDEAISALEAYCGKRTIGVEKSRGEGATWMVMVEFLRRWLFFDIQTFGLVSKDEKTANDHTNPDSLTFKMVWQLQQIGRYCPWMLPKRWDEQKHFLKSKGSIINPDNSSSVNAYSATGSVASGGRKTAVLMDELAKFPRPDDKEAMASLEPVTDCRILVSTPCGDSGAYYEAMHVTGSSMIKIVLHWPMNPTRNKGLYRWAKDQTKPTLFDEGYEYPKNYEFTHDGKLRSPWYDRRSSEPDMISDPRALAQEYDLNYGGSTVKFYGSELRERLEPLLREPGRRGEIDYDSQGSIGFWTEVPGGKVHLWCPMGKGRPAAGHYVVGVDVAAGLGGTSSSNSAIVALDVKTGEQILEWKDSMTPPVECAQLAVAICKWLAVGGEYPLLVWESNGSGGETFTQEAVNNLRYSRLYYTKAQTRHRQKTTKRPGFWTSDRTIYHEQVRKYLSSGQILVRSKDLFAELSQFEYSGDRVVHVGDMLKEDGATGKAHGDIVTALGMAVMGLLDLGGGPQPVESRTWEEELADASPDSSAGRLRAAMERRKAPADEVDWVSEREYRMARIGSF